MKLLDNTCTRLLNSYKYCFFIIQFQNLNNSILTHNISKHTKLAITMPASSSLTSKGHTVYCEIRVHIRGSVKFDLFKIFQIFSWFWNARFHMKSFIRMLKEHENSTKNQRKRSIRTKKTTIKIKRNALNAVKRKRWTDGRHQIIIGKEEEYTQRTRSEILKLGRTEEEIGLESFDFTNNKWIGILKRYSQKKQFDS